MNTFKNAKFYYHRRIVGVLLFEIMNIFFFFLTLGQLIYEMCTVLPIMDKVRPTSENFQEIKDSELQELTEFIFETATMNGHQKELIEQVGYKIFLITAYKFDIM